MDTLNLFLIGCAMGVLSSYIAIRTRKDPILWFVIGFCFSLLGICINLLVSTNFFKKIRAKPLHLPKKKSPPPQKTKTILDRRLWYFLDQKNTQHGPMSLNALEKNILDGKIGKKTFIWNDDLDNWKKAQELTELKSFFSSGKVSNPKS